MNRHQGSSLALCRTIVLLVILLATGPVMAVAADEDGVADTSSPPAVVMSQKPDSADESFDDFDDFEEIEADTGQPVFDPLSGYNRVMTRVNDRLYYWALKPVAKGYQAVVAEPARVSIGNFFRNLGFPVRLVNNLLQLKFERAATETVRFIVNTSVGIAGLRDSATTMMELPVYSEDFGQTLGHYGLGGGFHVVLPLFGPSNVRDACGKVADWFLDPVDYIVEDARAETAVTVVDVVNGTSLRIGQYEAMTRDSLDLYILLRDAYESNRKKNIKE